MLVLLIITGCQAVDDVDPPAAREVGAVAEAKGGPRRPFHSLAGDGCGDWGNLTVATEATFAASPSGEEVEGTTTLWGGGSMTYLELKIPDLTGLGIESASWADFFCAHGDVYLDSFGWSTETVYSYWVTSIYPDQAVLVWPFGAATGDAWSYRETANVHVDSHDYAASYTSEVAGELSVGGPDLVETPFGTLGTQTLRSSPEEGTIPLFDGARCLDISDGFGPVRIFYPDGNFNLDLEPGFLRLTSASW